MQVGGILAPRKVEGSEMVLLLLREADYLSEQVEIEPLIALV